MDLGHKHSVVVGTVLVAVHLQIQANRSNLEFHQLYDIHCLVHMGLVGIQHRLELFSIKLVLVHLGFTSDSTRQLK